MGFYSWTSCVSKKSIMNTYTAYHKGVLAVLPDDTIVKGDYTGYGSMRINMSNNEDGYDPKEIDIRVIYEFGGDFEKYFTLSKNEIEKRRLNFIGNKTKICLMFPGEYRAWMKYNDMKASNYCPNQGYFEVYPDLILK